MITGQESIARRRHCPVPNACGSVNCNFLPGTHPGIAKDAHGEVYMKGNLSVTKQIVMPVLIAQG